MGYWELTNNKMPNKVIALLLAVCVSSCVSQKQYDGLWSQKAALEVDKGKLEERLSDAQAQATALEEELNNLKNTNTSLNQEVSQKTENLAALNNQYDNLLANSDELNKEFVAQQQRIRELEKILEEKEKAVNDLKASVSKALLNFKENDLTVEIKNGKVYVSLAEQLLFGSGSIKVDEKGVQALNQLASVLNENNDINILVEGHTDNVPISKTGAYMKNNWDLSVMRATSIVNILTEQGVAPERITASGRGEFIPLTSNDEADGRKKNRRTEIILTPQLDELFQILESN